METCVTTVPVFLLEVLHRFFNQASLMMLPSLSWRSSVDVGKSSSAWRTAWHWRNYRHSQDGHDDHLGSGLGVDILATELCETVQWSLGMSLRARERAPRKNFQISRLKLLYFHSRQNNDSCAARRKALKDFRKSHLLTSSPASGKRPG